MFTSSNCSSDTRSHHNSVNTEQFSNHQSSRNSAASFIKRLNPFSKSKSHEISCLSDDVDKKLSKKTNEKDFASVKVLKQFWNDQIKTTKSTENLNKFNCKSATIKYLSQSNDSIYDKSQTLDGRNLTIVDDFNKFKDANFVKNQKNRWLKTLTSSAVDLDREIVVANHFPTISSIGGGKIHWTKREEILSSTTTATATTTKITTKSEEESTAGEIIMTTIKTPQHNSSNSNLENRKTLTRKESISSAGSITSSSTNSANRKFSFKTSPSTRLNYTKKIASNGSIGSSNKVAQIAQRFNQIIQQDTSLLDQVKKRGTVVVHSSGGRVFKIKEEKKCESPKKQHSTDDDDDAMSLPSIGGKNSTRRKSMLKKRPSIRILVESPKKDGGAGNVLMKKQLYETNVVNKETIVVKPKIPDKSERVLAKTLEIRENKQKQVVGKTEKVADTSLTVDHQVQQSKTKNNFQKIYDKISFRPTFLYGKKPTVAFNAPPKTSTTTAISEENICLAVNTAIASSNNETNDISNDLDDLDLSPIDMKLNVYFKDENLSTTTATKEDEDENEEDEKEKINQKHENSANIKSQGSLDDVDDVSKVKPNSSFLFRTQPKLETPCDVFIRDMLHSEVENEVEHEISAMECNSNKSGGEIENNYEIISKMTGDVSVDIARNEEENENIYQSLSEVKGERRSFGVVEGDNESVKSYESFENYDEIAQNILDNKMNFADIMRMKLHEDDYILPEKAPEPPPPRKNTIPLISQPILTSTTSTLIQNEMQVPMIVPNYELKKSNSATSTTYEKIKYDKLSNDDENIYDTIKNIDKKVSRKEENCENQDNTYENAKNETMSIISNCYESISLRQNNYSTINQILRNAISTTTLTSEHRINSIYGTMVGQSLTPPSDRSASDNSDDWIDLSDEENEVENDNNRFIVICKKTKNHKTHDWSRLVRQKLDEWDDDSDHHYESLNSIQQQRAKLEGKLDNLVKPLNQQKPLDFDRYRDNEDDEFDSFDDSEDEDENQQSTTIKSNTKNIVGDFANSKQLPEPPSNSGQVYAFVQRIKNFGSISKNEISKGISKFAKKRGSIPKIPTSRSQFYENSDETNYIAPKYDSKSLGKKSRGLAKLQKLGRLTINKLPTNFNLNDPFEQSTTGGENHENHSSPNLSNSLNNFNTDADRERTNIKTMFRKGSSPSISSTSNIYGALNSKSSTFYVTDSVDVDSGIFAVNEKSTSSPDNSNLNLSSTTTISASNSSINEKRRSVASINGSGTSTSSRPNEPPPAPPTARRSGSTSWYAECGLFNHEEEHNHDDAEKNSDKNSNSWYTESGLYQTSNTSVASSSGSSGVSTGGECSPCGDDNSHSMFLNEPLYQLYTAAKLESISSSEFEPEIESDGYEEITKKEQTDGNGGGNEKKKQSRPTALQLIEPNVGPSRTLWSEVNEVIQSGIFVKLSQNEKRLQEAKFEVLTSEASYLKSLNLLRSHFMNHPAFRDPETLDPTDRKTLFSYIIPVLECSDRLLCDLESCWQDNIMLANLSKHIFKHAEKHFHVYIQYCEHQGRLDRTLKRLKESNTNFKERLDALENDPVCCGLNLHSFLMLPMQRITRLPLLIDAVMTKLKSHDEEFDDWKITLAILNKIVSQCNQAANRCEQAFEMEVLSKQIEFPANISPFPLIPFNPSPHQNPNRLSRTLVRRGELTHIIYRGDDAKLTFGKKSTVKKNIYCFLFTDILILTKKKSDDSFIVFDYCQRSLLTLSSGDVIPQLPVREMNQAGKYIMFMSLLENCIGKPVDLILSCPSETERERWLQAMTPPTSENPYETLYEEWDCPQVSVKHPYQSLEPDELTLDIGDVVNVLRKMNDDGWYFGERTRDGVQGWFPGNYTEEIHSAHVRSRNLKQRHRLLLYTATYLEAQKEQPNMKKK